MICQVSNQSKNLLSFSHFFHFSLLVVLPCPTLLLFRNRFSPTNAWSLSKMGTKSNYFVSLTKVCILSHWTKLCSFFKCSIVIAFSGWSLHIFRFTIARIWSISGWMDWTLIPSFLVGYCSWMTSNSSKISTLPRWLNTLSSSSSIIAVMCWSKQSIKN